MIRSLISNYQMQFIELIYYQILKTITIFLFPLGKGGFAKVFLIKKKSDGIKYAVKAFNKEFIEVNPLYNNHSFFSKQNNSPHILDRIIF